jgi:hypothetical protein
MAILPNPESFVRYPIEFELAARFMNRRIFL